MVEFRSMAVSESTWRLRSCSATWCDEITSAASASLWVLLGLVVLFNLRLAVPSLLGLSIQVLLESVALLVPGRLRPRGAAAA